MLQTTKSSSTPKAAIEINSRQANIAASEYDKSALTKEIVSAAATCKQILSSIEEVVLGKPNHIRLALACLLAQGHLLIEDVPGVGKTTLAHALAVVLNLRFNRVQFTSDLMPADVLGGSVYDRQQQSFVFHPGPIFAELLLVDEINRASPKTQSALLEAMAESQISIDGKTYSLPTPFFVIATQNPITQVGTFALPESQVDRFLMTLSLGYPDELSEKKMLMRASHKTSHGEIKPVVDVSQVIKIQYLISKIIVSEAVTDYAYRVITNSRTNDIFVDGLSPRAGMSWMHAAQAWALIDGRTWVTPDDLQAVFIQIASHRLKPRSKTANARSNTEIIREWLQKIPVHQ